jgi:glutathione synthase
VVALRRGDKNVKSLIDLLTHEGRRLALVQEFMPEVVQGDKRVLVLDGKSLGAILRVPQPDDIRANIHVGGTVQPTELSAREADLVAAVGQRLASAGLWFVGLDLIGERLIEVNVTSPTGIQELGRFQGRPVEEDVIAWVERRVSARR